MAIVVTRTITQNGKYFRLMGSAVSGSTTADITGLALDISAFTLTNDTYDAYTNVRIVNVNMTGGSVNTVMWSLRFEATADVPFIGVMGGGTVSHDFTAGNMSGYSDPQTTGTTADILLYYDGVGFTATDECVYSIEGILI